VQAKVYKGTRGTVQTIESHPATGLFDSDRRDAASTVYWLQIFGLQSKLAAGVVVQIQNTK